MTWAVRISYRSPKTARQCGLCEDEYSVDKDECEGKDLGEKGGQNTAVKQ